jgi:type II secretory pathway component PulK
MNRRKRISTISTMKKSRRAGAVLVVAIVSILITSLILASLVQMTTLTRRQERAELLRLQAEWLAESAIERAADRLAADAKYTGEAWLISAPELGDGNEAKVDISIKAEPDGAQMISVAAVYPSNSSSFAKISKQVTFRLPSKTQP